MSSFKRIMQHGQKKVKTTAQSKQLLSEFADNNHKLIAQVIDKWLKQDLKQGHRNK